MKIKAPYQCDYCGQNKGETNHWWLRPKDVASLRIGTPVFTLLHWDDKLADLEEDILGVGKRLVCEHICSEQCVIKAISQYLSRQKNAPIAKTVAQPAPEVGLESTTAAITEPTEPADTVVSLEELEERWRRSQSSFHVG